MRVKIRIGLPVKKTPYWIEAVNAIPQLTNVFRLPYKVALKRRYQIFIFAKMTDYISDLQGFRTDVALEVAHVHRTKKQAVVCRPIELELGQARNRLFRIISCLVKEYPILATAHNFTRLVFRLRFD